VWITPAWNSVFNESIEIIYNKKIGQRTKDSTLNFCSLRQHSARRGIALTDPAGKGRSLSADTIEIRGQDICNLRVDRADDVASVYA
jgi:hypothetical protein